MAELFYSDAPQATERIASELTAGWPAGQMIALVGELGAGKTRFVRGVVAALGGDPRAVSSPTYALVHRYPTPAGPIYHLDAYRVGGAADFEGIGFDELAEDARLMLVEWPGRVAALIPPNALCVTIEHVGQGERQIRVSRWEAEG